MAWEPDYVFYAKEYKGKAPEAAFDEQLGGAVAHVNWMIGCNEVSDGTAVAYKRAVCAVADSFALYGSGDIASMSVGTFGVSFSGRKSGKDVATDAATCELAGTGLLFAGVL